MKIVAIATSRKKGTRKTTVQTARLIKEHGLEDDAHAGAWHRQVSFLAAESIARMRATGLDVTFGDFAENVATEGIDWKTMPIGTQLKLGRQAIVEITQIGKECHKKCAIYYQAGDCIMPKEGIFTKVVAAGTIKVDDEIKIIAFPK